MRDESKPCELSQSGECDCHESLVRLLTGHFVCDKARRENKHERTVSDKA